ncbi:hypothetical protein SUGI_0356180 [Cryptomeria japonica]|nr:hypothetical protein SUGI_0356180 [Cryptomeria japonica]
MASLSSQATISGQPSSDNERRQYSFDLDRYGQVVWSCNDSVDGTIAYDNSHRPNCNLGGAGKRSLQFRRSSKALLQASYIFPSSRRAVKKWKSHRDVILQLLLPLIQFARRDRVYFKQSAPDCYLNCLLSVGEEDDEENKLKFSDEEIALNLFELALLAVDSTSSALEWALAHLITHPNIQERA